MNIDLVDRRYLDQMAMPPDTGIHVKVAVEELEREVLDQLLASRWSSQIREIFVECRLLRDDPKEVEGLLSDFGFGLIHTVMGCTMMSLRWGIEAKSTL